MFPRKLTIERSTLKPCWQMASDEAIIENWRWILLANSYLEVSSAPHLQRMAAISQIDIQVVDNLPWFVQKRREEADRTVKQLNESNRNKPPYNSPGWKPS